MAIVAKCIKQVTSDLFDLQIDNTDHKIIIKALVLSVVKNDTLLPSVDVQLLKRKLPF